ncbi:MAG: acetoin utilization protein AcuC [Candidatus Omnitrophica bacterium]|nr:acetoin utilization protein AcuC [Candidatus Omnitrophota bacterium]
MVLDDKLAKYSFSNHPFGSQRYFAFKEALEKSNLLSYLRIIESRQATDEELLLFHTQDFIEFVKRKEKEGGYFDNGDTPAIKGIYEATKLIVGTTLNCIDTIIKHNIKVFSPIGGLHHAYKNKASGFCVFNDICVGINYLRKKYGIKKILYFDIDAHHGDGVYYSYEEDPYVYIVDFHQVGIFPGTGSFFERGIGEAVGTKLNIELEAGATDRHFFERFNEVVDFVEDLKVDFIIMQAGCDCMLGDPITFLNLTEKVHRETAKFLIKLANRKTNCRLLILGGGGYLLSNIKKAWVAIMEELLENDESKETTKEIF